LAGLAILMTVFTLIWFLRLKSQKIGVAKREIMFAAVSMYLILLQTIAGIVLWFQSPNVLAARQNIGEAMKNSDLRLALLEHPLMMLIAVTLVHVGYIKAKKTQDSDKKWKLIFYTYLIGLLFILSRIPYEKWLGIG